MFEKVKETAGKSQRFAISKQKLKQQERETILSDLHRDYEVPSVVNDRTKALFSERQVYFGLFSIVYFPQFQNRLEHALFNLMAFEGLDLNRIRFSSLREIRDFIGWCFEDEEAQKAMSELFNDDEVLEFLRSSDADLFECRLRKCAFFVFQSLSFSL